MTPKFESRWLMPIVSQMFSQSASNCSLRKRTARRGGRPRRELQQRGSIVAPIVRPNLCCSCRRLRRQNLHVSAAGDGGSCNAADFERVVFLLITNRLFERENDKLL